MIPPLGRRAVVGLATGLTAGLGLIALIIYQEVKRRRRRRCQKEVLEAAPPPLLAVSREHVDAGGAREQEQAQEQALAAVEEAVRGLPPGLQVGLRAQLDQVLSCVSSLRSEVAELRGGLQNIALQIITDVKTGLEDGGRARRRRELRGRCDSLSSSSVYFSASQGAEPTPAAASEAGYSTAYADSDYTDRETDREEGGGEEEEEEGEEDQSCATVLTLRQEEEEEEEELQVEEERPVQEVLSGELALLLAQSDLLLTGDAQLRADGLQLLLDHRTQYGDSRDFLWRLARAYSAVHASTPDPEHRTTVAQQGREEAESVLRRTDLDADCHVRFAALAGLTSPADSMHSRLKGQRIMKEHLDRALALRDDLPLTFYLLGRWSYQVATLGWLERKAAAALYHQPPRASARDALDLFMKAEQLGPGSSRTLRLHIAKCHKELGDRSAARRWTLLALETGLEPGRTPEDEEERTTLEAELSDLTADEPADQSQPGQP